MASQAPQRRKRRPAPVVAERVSRTLITIGGIGTILAVTLIFFFLVGVVVPLFLGGEADNARVAERTAGPEETLLGLGVDGGTQQAWSLAADGVIRVVETTEGKSLQRFPAFAGLKPTALVQADLGDEVLFGFEDGSIAFAEADFEVDFLDEEPPGFESLEIGEAQALGDAVVERTPERQLRRTRFVLRKGASLQLTDAPITSLALSRVTSGPRVAAVDERGRLTVARLRERPNFMTGQSTLTLRGKAEIELGAPARPDAVALLSGSGRFVMLLEPEGSLRRWNFADLENVELTDSLDVAPAGARVTAAQQLLGRESLVIGDSEGVVSVWFSANVPVDGEEAAEEAGEPAVEVDRLLRARELWDAPAPISALAISGRSRLLAVGTEGGELRIFNSTTGAEVVKLDGLETPSRIVLSPKETGFSFIASDGLHTYDLDARFPEVTLGALFGAVWYEGYAAPEHVWQSSSGSDEFEPKFGTVPLIFGTLKATLYSMLFGAPLAILAALFSSEFLARRWRTSVKSTIELMASLPSVVLGFMAAMVIAPFVRDVLPATLLSLLFVPLLLLFGAYLWQLLPVARAVRLSGWPRLGAIGLTLPIALGLAVACAGPFESLLFAGNLEAWLDGQVGRAFGGWFYLLMPLSAFVVAIAVGRSVTPRLAATGWGRKRLARADLFKFIGGAAATIGLAAVIALGLDLSGADPRGGVVGTYVQRNALIVGVVMGFAIIPIIYTLAEDALSEVPSHLREASLGAGATPWQTAIRVVVPVGMSGIFSAVMIGLGRAVGETMIVLMAAGNTPLLEWNIFNGFRTLSANIAVELPEAVQGSAHYRTLFLAALVLFLMTFVLNSFAEMVRRSFRKKASAL